MSQTLIKYEKNERMLAHKLFRNFKSVEDYYFTSGRTCYDMEIVMKNEKVILGEVKVRGFKIDKYPDYILQVDKLQSLIKKAQKKNINTIYYINFFESDIPETKDFIIFNLSERIKYWQTHKPMVVKKWMNAATYVSIEDKVEKQVIMLSYDPSIDMKGNFSLN